MCDVSQFICIPGINLEQVRTAEERSIREACDKVVRSRTKELDVVTVDGEFAFKTGIK